MRHECVVACVVAAREREGSRESDGREEEGRLGTVWLPGGARGEAGHDDELDAELLAARVEEG